MCFCNIEVAGIVRRGTPYSCYHYDDVIMGVMASQITSLTIVYSTVYSDVDQGKHQSSASLASAQMASNAENVSIWWRHHDLCSYGYSMLFVDILIDMINDSDVLKIIVMMTSSNGSIFCVTGPLWGEFIGHRWITIRKAIDAEICCLLWSAPEQTVQ